MPRVKRRKDADLLRHVVSRGVGRQTIFHDDRDYRSFAFLLGQMVDEFDVFCWDFTIMPNHFHLTLYNDRENLSEAIQYLKGEYATRWNSVRQRVGHVFEGPFKDQVVEEEDYLRSLTRYIALNPVRAGLAQRPEDWPWSSYRYLAGLEEPPEFLMCEPVLRHFGDPRVDPGAAREAYVQHVRTTTPKEQFREEAFRSRQRVIGSREFKKFMKSNVAGEPLSGRQKPSDLTRGLIAHPAP